MSRRLDAAYVAQQKAIRTRVQAFTLARFAAGQYRDKDLALFVKQVVPVVLAGRRQVSALTDAYLSRVLAEAGAKVPPRAPVDTDNLRGVDAAEVYTRPFVTVRTALSKGTAFDAAVAAGGARLTDIVLADMQMSKTHTARNVFASSSRVEAFERTLTGSVNCALCYIASTQRYSKKDLLPIHPGCDCGVSPILDTGEQVIYPDRLASTHEAVGDRFGFADQSGRDVGLGKKDFKDYSDVMVREHGELGPVLSIRGQAFTGPGDLH